MRRALTLAGVTLAHAVASVAALLWSYSASSAAFDGRPMSWLTRHVAGPLQQVLWFPLALFTRAGMPGVGMPPVIQYTLVLANSALWAWVLVRLWSRWSRRLHS